MKASELMLGDIITFKDSVETDEIPIPIKVIALGYQHSDDENEALVQIGNDETCDIVTIDEEFVGYPLTAEILEKNGFKIVRGFGYSETYPTYGWGYHKGLRDFASVDVTFYDEPIGGVSRLVKMETVSKKDDGINSIHSCDIDSVHELQHALRLCGIDKTIIL